ncbi:cytochrome P450 [Aspergillus clavatus NRRL 1]|uniref:Benzoate 4-monooxygenase cytochrome P450 n=1 Tax=Aspergillus clavatus (strain ATCC 1007 / CBS 513.65 / DSM 816 / NCTC 3887 / NRRL 1 / QM 1276 / 107) TaxID=344612 RepID=A1C4K6_ASPCL|nr:benzoate 4-monooxygenase cytochrome P450 [Aspergillus clavatus NRRL 1]EAW15346.1 benzoate 4-monooxygenase cytochrome P450 [Aspergillus clavatus NRRL 1]
MSPLAYILFGGTIGLGMHHGLFIHGEWHIQAPLIVLYHFTCFSVLLMTISHAEWLIGGYLLSLYTSIAVYRLFYHRLNSFSGPVLARTTKLWHVWKARHRQNHLVLLDLYQRYGEVVRTGPSEVTVFHPDVFMAIDGPTNKCVKSEWYDLLHPDRALVTVRVKEVHSARRRQWNRGFSSKALDQYSERILAFIDQLDHCIEKDIAAGRVSEATDLFYWLGFDRMGDFIFSRTFDMLSRQAWHHIILLLQRALSILGPLSPVPWLIHIAFKLFPRVWVLRDWFNMMTWCEAQMRKRMQVMPDDPTKVPDVAHYLIQDANDSPQDKGWLTGDSILAIVAGSEPTAAVLVGVFTELARHPQHAETIRREMQQLDIRDARALAQHCPHLDAVIFEALRLYPALPTGGNRKTLQEGTTIGGTFIPPETTIVAPRFVISRREDCFEQADQFIPERWTTRPEMVRNRAAFAPFGTGHHSCLGRALAMNDMRLVTARLVQKYNFRFPPGDKGEAVLRDLRDQFTSNPGRLRLIFEVRKKRNPSDSD